MFSVIALSLAMINYSNTYTSVPGYAFSTSVEFKSNFNDSYLYSGDDYTYVVNAEFYLDIDLKFNDLVGEYLVTVTSSTLYSQLNVFDYNGDVVNYYSYSGTINTTFDLPAFSSPKDFKFVPVSTPYGFSYEYYFDNSLKGNFFINDMKYDVNLSTFTLSSGLMNGYCGLVKNNIINNNSYDVGYDTGYENGYDDGSTIAYSSGYADGFNQGASQDATAVAIFSGIISVGLIPINFFLACLNFEVFGINIGAFISALLTVAIVVIITRMIVSGGNGGDK